MVKHKLASFMGAVIALLLTGLAGVLWFYIISKGGGTTIRAADTAVALTSGGNSSAGENVIISFGCAACHEIPGIRGPHGKIGPSLEDFKESTMIGGVMANSAENLTQWLQDPRAVDPKTGMPNLGLTQDQARDVAAYLYAPE